ncbi:hypothetical protein NC652_006926 [Populus alba x Populus x berolinensis]|uniref:Uncharacterized protein n=1 Tax=Populus alba x Populus x berolinensis TaxID=444605 RepID=A0AAD6WDK4_9ROSI|nr:hypothetical protein NC652_006926 [Populus alba x Populus x berolinensis]KAJ7007956.1 hypothetical protein NC653_006860 [Populus alba x Populus x berolinensis]
MIKLRKFRQARTPCSSPVSVHIYIWSDDHDFI